MGVRFVRFGDKKRSPKLPPVLALLLVPATWAGLAPDPGVAYIERGHQTEARQQVYHERIERFYGALSEAIRQAAPDLLPRIAPPPPDVHGYQILPKIAKDGPAPKPGKQAEVVRFSWNATGVEIERQMGVLDGIEAKLQSLPRTPGRRSRAAYEILAADYQRVVARRKTIDSNVQYNWLWQKQIAEGRSVFDYLQKTQDQVLERDAIQSALASRSDAKLRAAAGKLGVDTTRSVEYLRGALAERLRVAKEGIHAFTDRGAPPDLVAIEHPAAGRWLLRVTLYTDVTDATFVRDVKDAIEGWWHVSEGGEEFQVELAVKTLSPEQLYCGHWDGTGGPKGDCAPPAYGADIDLEAHVARFPEDGAVLTTGATTLRTTGPRAIVLGPNDTAPRVLAHEFGHILGLPDTYVRGYRDLGADGFEVTELADFTDIMGAPGAGPVLPRHFERLITARTRSLLNLSFQLYNQRRFNDSIDAAQRALVLNPDYAEAYNNMGASYAALQLWDLAIRADMEAVRLQPDSQLAKNNLAWATEQKRHDSH